MVGEMPGGTSGVLQRFGSSTGVLQSLEEAELEWSLTSVALELLLNADGGREGRHAVVLGIASQLVRVHSSTVNVDSQGVTGLAIKDESDMAAATEDVSG
jgi:hypothetical protein